MKAAEVKNEISWDWMRPEMATVQVDSLLEDAITKMRKLAVHHLIVMDDEKFIGLLDSRDCAGIWDRRKRVGELMRFDIPPIDENTEIEKVLELMINRGITGVPLKRNHRVCGIITSTDLLRLMNAHLSQQTEVTEWIERGKTFLSKPIVQSLSRLLGNAGV